MSVDQDGTRDGTDNNLLEKLTAPAMAALRSGMTRISLNRGDAIYEAGDEVDFVYFPRNGMLSLLTVLSGGKAIEVATVGREGVVGAMAGLGLYNTLVRVVVQLPLDTDRISSVQFRKAVQEHDEIASLCIRYNEVLLTQARVTAACNALHSIEQRTCRWLLQSADRAESASFGLTQEFLSEMLGVRRTSVTEAASNLQDAKLISFSRGKIRVTDREGLEARCCECYRSLIDKSATLIPAKR